MNYYPHHIGDYTKDTAHLSMLEDGAYRRLIDLYYSSEQPLPTDRAKLYRLVRALTKQERATTDAILAEFFAPTGDGWRHKRCDEEIAKANEASEDNKARNENERERQKRARARRKAVFAELRERGQVPKWDTPMAELEAMLSHTCHTPVTRDDTVTSRNETRLTNSQEPIANSQSSAQPPVDNSTSAGRTSAALRALGVDVTPANPLLLAWVAAGVTEAHIAEAVERARLHKPKPARIPAAYLDPIVREVIAGPTAPAARASPAWWTTEAETTAKGKELGLYPRGGESWDAFRGRIRAAINQGVAHAS